MASVSRKRKKAESTLRNLRLRWGLTQVNMAKVLNVHHIYLIQLENGHRDPGPHLLMMVDWLDRFEDLAAARLAECGIQRPATGKRPKRAAKTKSKAKSGTGRKRRPARKRG